MNANIRVSLADLLINLSAGWIGAGYGVFFLANENITIKISLLTGDILLAILCLSLAIWLRRKKK